MDDLNWSPSDFEYRGNIQTLEESLRSSIDLARSLVERGNLTLVATSLKYYIPSIWPRDRPLPTWLIRVFLDEFDPSIGLQVLENMPAPNRFILTVFLMLRCNRPPDELGVSRRDAVRDVVRFAVRYETRGLGRLVDALVRAPEDLGGALDVASMELETSCEEEGYVPTAVAERVNAVLIFLINILERFVQPAPTFPPELYFELGISRVLARLHRHESPELFRATARLIQIWGHRAAALGATENSPVQSKGDLKKPKNSKSSKTLKPSRKVNRKKAVKVMKNKEKLVKK